jgi:ABC-type lipoprotein release transport system permease subunit
MRKSSIFHYAIKSIFRQKSRNFFIILIVCLTSVFSLFTASLFEGKNAQIERNIIETETGNYQLIEKNYFEKYDPLKPYFLNQETSEKIKHYHSTPELLLKTTILHPEGAQELTLIGIEPQSHEVVFPLKEFITGAWPLSNDGQKNVVIGQKFADKLKLKLGDELVITYQDQSKAILNESLPITGIFHTFGPGFESHNAFVSKNFIGKLINITNPDAFHRIVLRSKTLPKPENKNQNLVLKSWDELHPELTVMMKFHNGVTRALIIFMLVIAYVSIITPVNVLWDERKDEVKFLQTIGASEKTLYLIASYEAFVLTLFALGLSVIIWGVLHGLASIHGLDFSMMGERSVVRGGILISSVVYPVINILHSGTIIIFHGLIIFGSNFWCIRSLLRKEALGE